MCMSGWEMVVAAEMLPSKPWQKRWDLFWKKQHPSDFGVFDPHERFKIDIAPFHFYELELHLRTEC